LDSRWD